MHDRTRVMTCAYARVKFKKCSKFISDQTRVHFRRFWAFPKFPRVRVRACVFARVARTEARNSVFFTWFGFLIQHLAISIHFQSLSTDNKVIRVRQSSKSARAPIGKYSEKWWYCLLSRSSSECRVTPTFYYMVGKLMSCRYDIMRQNGWSDVVTSSYGRFNSKIWFLICDVINFCIHFSVSRLSFVKFLPNFSML